MEHGSGLPAGWGASAFRLMVPPEGYRKVAAALLGLLLKKGAGLPAGVEAVTRRGAMGYSDVRLGAPLGDRPLEAAKYLEPGATY